MYAVIVELKIAEGAMAGFLPLMHVNAATSLRDEPGCQQFDVCIAESDPLLVVLYEVYDNRAAFEAHLGSAHFKSFDAAVADMITDKRVVTAVRAAQPG